MITKSPINTNMKTNMPTSLNELRKLEEHLYVNTLEVYYSTNELKFIADENSDNSQLILKVDTKNTKSKLLSGIFSSDSINEVEGLYSYASNILTPHGNMNKIFLEYLKVNEIIDQLNKGGNLKYGNIPGFIGRFKQ